MPYVQTNLTHILMWDSDGYIMDNKFCAKKKSSEGKSIGIVTQLGHNWYIQNLFVLAYPFH